MLMWVLLIISIRPVHLLWATPAFICLVYFLPLQIDFLLFHPASLLSVSLLFECHIYVSRVDWYILNWYPNINSTHWYLFLDIAPCVRKILYVVVILMSFHDVWCEIISIKVYGLFTQRELLRHLFVSYTFSPSTKIFLIVHPSSIFIGSRII